LSESERTGYFSKLARELSRRAARAVLSDLGPASPALRSHLSDLLERQAGRPGSFLSDLVFEPMFEWQRVSWPLKSLAGKVLSPRLIECMSNPPGELKPFRFGEEWRPYVHQVEAWEALAESPRLSIGVTSGTGSGKTECFLVPILNDLVRETEERGEGLVGVRALFLYPLNALINSQRDRLRAWTAGFGGKIRFCLYNGDTPESAPAILRRETPEQVLERRELRLSPPPLLVTNGTMLEYMLVRSEDESILVKSAGALRWVVLDEAHSYIGSQAAEISLLLRRVLHAFGVRSEDVQFVATSATLTTGSGRRQLQQFIADIAGIPASRVRVIAGKRAMPAIPAPSGANSRSALDLRELAGLPDEKRFALLASRPECVSARKRLGESPFGAVSLTELTEVVTGRAPGTQTEGDRLEALALMDICSATRSAKDGQWFLPLRGHFFHRTQSGMWSCCYSKCDGRRGTSLEDESWPFGKLFLERRERCDACGSLVFELMVCGECGEEYLVAEEFIRDGEMFLSSRASAAEDDDFAFELEADEESDEGSEESGTVFRTGLLRLLQRVREDAMVPTRFDRTTGKVLSDRGGGIEIALQIPDYRGHFHCHRCGRSSREFERQFRPLREGSAFLLGVGIPALLEQMPPFEGNGSDKPAGGRRLLTFSDSRQGTARFALRAQIESERNYVRSVVYHAVAAARRLPDSALVDKLRKDVEVLRAQKSSTLAGILSEKLAQLEKAERVQPGVLSWSEATEALQKSAAVRQWMRSLKENLPPNLQSPSDVARFCLFREFMRRPKRQNSLETLGLIKTDYAFLEKIDENDAPACWRARGFSGQGWRDLLKLVIDSVLRGRSAINVPEGFLYWMGAPVRTQFVEGPEAESSSRRTFRWPVVGRTATRVRIIIALGVALGLDPANPGDKDEINTLMRHAWSQVRPFLDHFPDGYQLDLGKHLILRELSSGWLCPVTRRVLDCTLNGYSPYTTPEFEDRKCQPLEFPILPFPFNRRPSGERLSLTEIEEWLEREPLIARNREIGVWTEFSDRIAAFSDYFRVGEHSAQQSGSRLRALEGEFKRGELNVLSCSTTMELGVDVGGLSAVAMNNAPPSPANYQQRAGRAGRRGEGTAVGLTLCQSTPHGEAVFHDPLWPFRRKPQVAAVSLQNERIVQRHVNALLIGIFLKSLADDIPHLTAGWFFSRGDDDLAPVDRFIDWLETGSGLSDSRLADGVARLVAGTSLDGVDRLSILGRAGFQISGLRDRWRDEVESLARELPEPSATNTRIDQSRDPAQLAILNQLARVRGEYLLKELTSRAFLPVHGFPTNVVPFIPTTLQDFEREARRRREEIVAEGRSEREDNLGRRRGFPSRDLAIGIREYSPGARVVLDGRIYQSKGVTLNWKIPASDVDVRELQVFRVAWRCLRCFASGASLQNLSECPACRASEQNLKQHAYLEPAGFAVDITDKPDNDLSVRSFVAVMRPWISAGGEHWRPLPDPRFGRYRYGAEGHVFNHTKGPLGHGFAICLRCGRAAVEAEPMPAPLPKELVNHNRLRGRRSGSDPLCEGNDSPYAIKRGQWLGVSSSTDVFELQLIDRITRLGITSEAAALSIAVAFRSALSEHLGIQEREIGFAAVPSRTDTGTACWSAVVFDTAAGGAGYVAAAPEVLPALVRRARQVLDCPRGCDSSCHACLLDFDTQHEMARLNRKEGLKWLTEDLQVGLELPTALRVFGDSTRFEFNSLPLAIAQELERADIEELRLHLGGDSADWDPSEWSLRKSLLKWSATKRSIKILAPAALLDSLDPEQRADLASIGEAGDIELWRIATRANSAGSATIAEVGGPMRRVRWAVTNASAMAPNAQWAGGGAEDRVVRVVEAAALQKPEGTPAKFGSLRLTPPGSIYEIRLTRELDGNVAEIGHKFWREVSSRIPGLENRLRGKVPVVVFQYEDRYLRSPLHCKILFEIAKALLGKRGNGSRCAISIRTETLRYHGHSREPQSVADDWGPTFDRKPMLKKLFELIAQIVDLHELPKGELKHQRELSVKWEDGIECVVRLDEGVGWLKPSRWVEFPFRRDSEMQAQTIRQLALDIEARNKNGTVLYLFPLRSP